MSKSSPDTAPKSVRVTRRGTVVVLACAAGLTGGLYSGIHGQVADNNKALVRLERDTRNLGFVSKFRLNGHGGAMVKLADIPASNRVDLGIDTQLDDMGNSDVDAEASAFIVADTVESEASAVLPTPSSLNALIHQERAEASDVSYGAIAESGANFVGLGIFLTVMIPGFLGLGAPAPQPRRQPQA
jgi:hypothetical protein